MSRRRQNTWCAVCLDSTGTVHRCQVQAAANDERMPAGASVKRGKRVTHRLHSRRGERGALAYVESPKPVFIVPGFDRFPHCRLVSHSTVGQRIHRPVGDVLTVVQAEGSQVSTPICQSNHTIICNTRIQRSKSVHHQNAQRKWSILRWGQKKA